MFDLKYAIAKMIIVDFAHSIFVDFAHSISLRSWFNVGSKNYIIADSAQAEYCTTPHCLFVYSSSSSSSSLMSQSQSIKDMTVTSYSFAFITTLSKRRKNTIMTTCFLKA